MHLHVIAHRYIVYWVMESSFWPLGLFSQRADGKPSLGQRIAKWALTHFMKRQLKGDKDLEDKVRRFGLARERGERLRCGPLNISVKDARTHTTSLCWFCIA